jgi:hypothetical protein
MLGFGMTSRGLVMVAALALAACSASGAGTGDDDGSGAGTTGPGTGGGVGGNGGDGAGFTVGGGSTGGGNPNEITEVYGHSDDTLYVLVPETNAVSVVGTFDGCDTGVIDLAIDADNELIATTFDGLYTVDKSTANCTLISLGTYPNSLSFVPVGTLDPNVEALVGYEGTDYVRIDPNSGAVTVVTSGAITGGYQSSGDIVSVKDGGTFLTIKDDPPGSGNCDDCIVSVNPADGSIVTNYGTVGASQVFGLAYWGGTAYGFTNSGELYAITFDINTVSAVAIPIPNAPASLQFWGAGSSTSVPLEIPK